MIPHVLITSFKLVLRDLLDVYARFYVSQFIHLNDANHFIWNEKITGKLEVDINKLEPLFT